MSTKLERLDALVITRGGLTVRHAQVLAALLGIPAGERYPIIVSTPQRDKEDTLYALVDLTAATAQARPTLFLFEDAHWADPTTQEFLDLLVQRTQHLPLLVVMTHRPEFQPGWTQQGHVAALPLSRLNRKQSADAIMQIADGKALPDELLAQISAKADGVPLFLEELTKSVLDSGQLVLENDRYVAAANIGASSVPATLRDSLMARLDRVPAAKALAQIGAVAGREFSYQLLAAVSGAQAELAQGLQQLEETGLAFRRGQIPNSTYTFKHALVQDAAYESLLKSRRQELHAKFAAAIAALEPNTESVAPELLAHHFTIANNFEAAIPLWLKAGDLALARAGAKEAVLHLSTGLKHIVNLPVGSARDNLELDVRVLLSAAHMMWNGWQSNAVLDTIKPALALAKALRRFDSLHGIYYSTYAHTVVRGRTEEADAFLADAITTAQATQHNALHIATEFLIAASHFWLGNWASVEAHANQVYQDGTEVDYVAITRTANADPRHNSDAYRVTAYWMLGRPDYAVNVHAQRTPVIDRDGTSFMRGFWFTVGSLVFDLNGDYARSKQCVERAIQIGIEYALPIYADLMGPLFLAVANLRVSPNDSTIDALNSAIKKWTSAGGNIMAPYFKAALAEEMLKLSMLQQAEHVINESLEQIERPGWGERAWLSEALRVKGGIMIARDKHTSAEESLRESISVAKRQGAKSMELRAAVDLARLWAQQGNRPAARELLTPIYNQFTEGFGTRDLIAAKEVLGSVE